MADGTGNFTQLVGGGYQSVTKDGALTITTTYNDDFEVIGTSIDRAYDNVRDIDGMSERFVAAWNAVKIYLPDTFADTVQFADDRGNIVVIATVDDVNAGILNGDVIGRINSWDNDDNPGRWDRWINDEVIEVENYEWSINFHDADWNRLAEYGEREVYLDLNGADPNPLDETGSRLTSFVYKAEVDATTWSEITDIVSDETLGALDLDVTWDDVEYIQVQQNTWASVVNEYRTVDQLWDDSEEQLLVHGKLGDSDNTVFIGSITKRDGFIVLRDNNWDEVARVTDPDEAMSYDEVKAIYGDAFVNAWSEIGASLPSTFKDGGLETIETQLLYNLDKWGNILVFDANGIMIGEINNWSHIDPRDRPWDDEYPTETWENANFNFRVIQSDGNNDNWIDIGRYEEGKSTFHDADGGDLIDRSWTQVSSTVYERNSSTDDWAAKQDYLTDFIADKLKITVDGVERAITWDDVDRLEISNNTHTNYPNQWRDETDIDNTSSVRFFSEQAMNGGNWYASKFLGGVEKRGGFIEIYGSDWQTIARVADPDALASWEDIIKDHPGLAEAWDAVDTYLPSSLSDPKALKYTTDDNNIYAFTAAGVMAAQINYWNDEHSWDGWFDGKVLPVINKNYNYNFHDADWNNIANAGGFDRYIDEGDDSFVHDETGTNIGVRIYKFDPDTGEVNAKWENYNPNDTTGTIDWDAVTEVQVQRNSWEAISNKYRHEDWSGISSNTNIQYFEEVEGRGWSQFVGVIEKRDGYIEIRDQHWNVVAQKIDPTADPLDIDYDAMLAKYGDAFEEAWAAVGDMLPSVFKDVDGKTIEANLLYTSDKWDNILVFNEDGDMIGEIGYWSNANTWDRTWDDEYTSETHQNQNFNFRVLDDTSEGHRNFIDVARYEAGSNTLIDPVGNKTVDRDWEQVSSTLMERYMSAEDWASAGETYFIDELTQLLGFTWEDVDKIETGSRQGTEYAVRWRTEDEQTSESRVEFIREVEMNGGDWYAHDFLGSIEYRDGFIEIRDGDWNTVARIIDPSGAKTFAEVLQTNKFLDDAWEEVADSLPFETRDPTKLKFSDEDPYSIAAFDADGVMVLRIGKWDWHEKPFIRSDDIIEESYGYGYNFQDENWNRYAQADFGERLISDADHEAVIDSAWKTVSRTINKDDVSDAKWAEYNPNDATGTIVWDDVVEISVGVNEWWSEANFNRSPSNTDSSMQERVEYFVEVGDAWSTWTERVATTEREGNLLTIYDNDWERVGQIVVGELDGTKFTDILEPRDLDWLAEYGEIIAKYVDIDALEIIESSSGPQILLQDGEIFATVEVNENYENNGTELYYDYEIRDTNGDTIISLGGWNELDENGEPQAKPNGVKVREFFYVDKVTTEEWDALRAESEITIDGFDWADVGILTRQVWKNDWDNTGYNERTEYKFIRVDDETGRQDWHYFGAVHENGIIEIKDGSWNTIGYEFPEGSQPLPLTDDKVLGSGFEKLLDATFAQLMMHHNTDAPMFMDASEFVYMGGNAVKWTSSISTMEEGAVPASMVGEIFFQTYPDQWGNVSFELRFDRDNGHPLIEFGGWVSADANGEPDYSDAEVRIREYIYKTDLDKLSEDENWSDFLGQYGPNQAFADEIEDAVWNNVEMIELTTRYRDRDGALANDATALNGAQADRVEARFIQGDVDEYTGKLDLNWDWQNDYRIEFNGSSETLYIGNTKLMSALSENNTAQPFSNHEIFGWDTTLGDMVVTFVKDKLGNQIETKISGFKNGEILIDGDNVLLVDETTNDLIAIGELWYDNNVDNWGHRSFGINFQGDNGHNLIGFGGWSSVDENKHLNFEDYQIRLQDYFYKSELSETEWDEVVDAFGPTEDLVLPNWEAVQVIQVDDQYRDSNADPTTDGELLASLESHQSQFIEGYYDDFDDRLELYWGNWEDRFNIQFSDNVEQLRKGNQVIKVAIGRDVALELVTDFDTQFHSGFEDLIISTEVLEAPFTGDIGFTFKVDSVPNLYVFDPDGNLAGGIQVASWANDYEDVVQAYDMRYEDGSYAGWLWQSTQRDYTDLAGVTHTNVTSEASNIVISKNDDSLPLEAWKYLNDTFEIASDAGYEFYDLSQVRVRQEKVVDGSGQVVAETLFLQHDLPGSNNVARIGFDIMTGKAVVFDSQLKWPDPISTNYATEVNNAIAASVYVGTEVTNAVKAIIDLIMDAHLSINPLPVDFYVPNSVPDSNFDVDIDFLQVMTAMDAYEDMLASPALNVIEVTTGGMNTDTFTMKVTDNANDYLLSITSSSVTNFGGILNSHALGKPYDLMQIMDELDLFVEDALEGAGVFGDGIAYSSKFSFGAAGSPVEIYTSSVEDADDLSDYQPIIYRPDDDLTSEEIFLIGINEQDVYIYTPDDQVSITVSGIFDLATIIKGDSTMTDEVAFEMALDDFITEFLGNEPDPLV